MARVRPVMYQRREVINAILYVLRCGCQWCMLAKDFPPWKTVYKIFDRWRLRGVCGRMHDTLRRRTRQPEVKQPTPTAGIIDSCLWKRDW
ncbi:MAG: transposase [Planctomycetaceae bacterium]|nr:transposase [Planctomycetaceae bacterium]